MTDQTDRKDEVSKLSAEDEENINRLKWLVRRWEKKTGILGYGEAVDYLRSRLLAHDSLLKERDELKREVERLTIRHNGRDWCYAAKQSCSVVKELDKAESEVKELREELERSRGLREAAMVCPTGNLEHAISGRVTAHVRSILRAAIAYAAKEGAK